MFGIETRRGLLVLTGVAGTGKTSILNQILDWLRNRGRSTAFIFHTRVNPIGLLRLILADFGVPCESKSKSDLIRTLHHWLLKRHAVKDLPVLILDEAQALPPQTLDEIRLILNVETSRGKLLQIILSGQPELEEKLRLPALRQLRQRITFHSRVPVLTEKETAAYIARRLAVAGGTDTSVFPQEAVQSIHAISQGVPRVVNLLCEHALIRAYGVQRGVISPEMIQGIAMDFDLCGKHFAATGDETQPRHPYAVPFVLAGVLMAQSVRYSSSSSPLLR
jgi:general secretion pathway protein A